MYRGIYTAPPTEAEGIQMVYLPDRQVIRLDGWFNGRQGALQPMDLPLSEFLRGLGISLEDCRQALEGTFTAAAPAPAAVRTQAPAVTAEHSPRRAGETAVASGSTVTQK